MCKLTRGPTNPGTSPLIVALNECDKVAPVRGPELATTWSEERDRGTHRSENIVQKVALIHRQLALAGLKVDKVVPVTSDASPGFNIDSLKRAIEQRLWSSDPRAPRRVSARSRTPRSHPRTKLEFVAT